MRQIKLTKEEKEIENSLLKGEYIDIDQQEFKEIAAAVTSRRKDAILNIRINSGDLKLLKKKAAHHGIRYQTFISEYLHRIAHR
jgi:predicted DNA binding CopG/RHH family protein